MTRLNSNNGYFWTDLRKLIYWRDTCPLQSWYFRLKEGSTVPSLDQSVVSTIDGHKKSIWEMMQNWVFYSPVNIDNINSDSPTIVADEKIEYAISPEKADNILSSLEQVLNEKLNALWKWKEHQAERRTLQERLDIMKKTENVHLVTYKNPDGNIMRPTGELDEKVCTRL
jgi:hypothetical protein